MGESDRYQEYKNLKEKKLLLGSDNNALTSLLIMNAIFFLIILTMQVVYFFYEQPIQDFNNDVVSFFSLPANGVAITERPWTLVTYMFSDTGSNLMRIISNMVWLWAFGYILQEMTGNDKLIPIYIYGGLFGGIFFVGAHYVISPLHNNLYNSTLMGANASTMAVATATTYLSPDYRFFKQIRNGIPIWILLTIYLLIDFAGVASMSAAYSLSHVGGALAGFLFIVMLRKGKDAGAWMNKSYLFFINLFKPKFDDKKNIKKKVFYNTEGKAPFEKKDIINQNKIDEILDKINSKGYHFLTEEEKEILKKASEDDSL
jgi:membrane associated rhomboid family serine protease